MSPLSTFMYTASTTMWIVLFEIASTDAKPLIGAMMVVSIAGLAAVKAWTETPRRRHVPRHRKA